MTKYFLILSDSSEYDSRESFHSFEYDGDIEKLKISTFLKAKELENAYNEYHRRAREILDNCRIPVNHKRKNEEADKVFEELKTHSATLPKRVIKFLDREFEFSYFTNEENFEILTLEEFWERHL